MRTMKSGSVDISQSNLAIAATVAKTVMERNPRNTNNDRNTALIGLLYLFDATGDTQYLDYVRDLWREKDKHQLIDKDREVIHSLMFELWLRTGESALTESFVRYAGNIKSSILRSKEGAIVQPPTRMSTELLSGYLIAAARGGYLSSDKQFFDECNTQFDLYKDILRSKDTGLWYHGSGWTGDGGSISPAFWGPAQGLIIQMLVECLVYIPREHPVYDNFTATLKEFASRLKTLQDPRGMWHQVVDRPEAAPESRTTGLILHYLNRAINAGWIEGELYLPVTKKGLIALMGYAQHDGRVANTCIHTHPLHTFEEYLHRPSVVGEPYSCGPFLMAYASQGIPGIPGRIQKSE
jgi:unsaturated rhamnogalacturonyl hydrolase